MAQGTTASNDDARKAAIEKLAAIDFNTHSNAQIEKALSPFMKEGFIVGLTGDCRKASESLNGDASAYDVTVRIPTQGAIEDARGNTRTVLLGFHVASFVDSPLNELWELDAKKFVVVYRNLIHKETQKPYLRKELVLIANLMEDGKIKKGYVAVSDEFDVTKPKFITLQDRKFRVLTEMHTATEEA